MWKKAAVNTELGDKISSVKPQGEKELRRSDALSRDNTKAQTMLMQRFRF